MSRFPLVHACNPLAQPPGCWYSVLLVLSATVVITQVVCPQGASGLAERFR